MEFKTVVWSPLAEYSFFEITEYIESNFGTRHSNIFIAKVLSLAERLRTNNQLCPASEKVANYYKCTVSEQTSLIYRLSKSAIEIIDLVDNRSIHQF